MSLHTCTGDAAYEPMPGAIDGRWRPVDGYIGGVRIPETDLCGLALTIDEGRFSIGATEGVIAIHQAARGGDLDMMATSGPNRGQFVPAIFKYADRALLVCYDLSGFTRPTSFDAPPGTRRFVALYRRV